MSSPKIVRINVELTSDEALQLAQFCKRSYFDQYYELSEPGPSRDIQPGTQGDPHRRNQAYTMIHAIGKVGEALAEKGYAPR